nr:MAG TPA: hypothetical protein [Bacteriophage sp.]
MAKVDYDYTSRHWSSKKGREVNENLPPFFAETQVKVNGKNEIWPLYIPFDATDKTQGVVWLSDTLTDESASAGMTAMTPKGVKDNTLVATKNGAGQKVSTESVVFKGPVEFSGTVTGITSPDNPGGNIKNLVVKIANKNVLPTDEINYILGSGSIQNGVVTVPIGILPLNMIPSLTEDKLPNNISGSKIANGTITSDKITDGTLSYDKLSSTAKNDINNSIDAKVNAIPRNMYIQFSDGDVTSGVKTLTLGSTTTISASINAIPEGQVSSLFTPRS